MKKKIKKILRLFGPGFITGAADDDPSGIATYSIAGAQFGLKLSFLSWFLIPMMISVQEACARIGLVTGRGLAGVIKKYYSSPLVFLTISLLFIANTVNIGADLGIMAASLQMVTGFSFPTLIIFLTTTIVICEIFIPYKIYAKFLKILSLFLLAYVAASFLVVKNWFEVIIQVFTINFSFSKEFTMTVVGFLGTTISPYLFFWQTSEEVEEEIEKGKIKDFNIKPKLSLSEIKIMRKDTNIGMIFSNLMTLFIVITTAQTLHVNGIFTINSPQEAALAIKPFAGNLTYWLFTIGILGIGLQAVPILAGSVAYAISDAFGFKEGLFKSYNKAKIFYIILAASTFFGLLINLLKINIMQTLYYAAVINGIIAVPLIFIIMKIADDKRIVGKYRTPKLINFFGWLAFFVMAAAVLLMVILTV